jgi:CRP/FNR family cyclic AMP-dependent transcriptional regulator
MKKLIQFVKNISIFNDLTEAEIETLLASNGTNTYKYPANNIIVHKDDEGSELYLIIKGKVKVFLSDEDSREIILDTLFEGDYFGEISLFNSHKRSANVMTLAKSEILKIQRECIEDIIVNNSSLSLKLLSEMADKVRTSNEIISGIIFNDSKQRILKLLNTISEKSNEIVKGYKIIDRPLIKDIASLTGIARETASKMLHDLNKIGAIKLSQKKIMIPFRSLGKI